MPRPHTRTVVAAGAIAPANRQFGEDRIGNLADAASVVSAQHGVDTAKTLT